MMPVCLPNVTRSPTPDMARSNYMVPIGAFEPNHHDKKNNKPTYRIMENIE